MVYVILRHERDLACEMRIFDVPLEESGGNLLLEALHGVLIDEPVDLAGGEFWGLGGLFRQPRSEALHVVLAVPDRTEAGAGLIVVERVAEFRVDALEHAMMLPWATQGT